MTNNSTVQSIVSEEPKAPWYKTFFAAVVEWFRKQIVALKRRPSNIPFFVQAVILVVFSFNLTPIAETAGFAGIPYMALYSFVVFLASILIMVIFINAFPKRQKVKKAMIVLLFITMVLIILFGTLFALSIDIPFTREENRLDYETISEDNKASIVTARSIIQIVLILQAVNILLLATLPLYSKLIKKINTTVKLNEGPTLSVVEHADEE
jgi:hypothetical protein